MDAIFGAKDHVDLAQECARAFLIFFYGLIMLRLSGRRTFVQMSALDLVISFIIGSALSRALTGGAPLMGTLAAVAVLVLLHVAVSIGVARSEFLSRLVEGRPVSLVRDGRLDDKARMAHMISKSDLEECVRQKGYAGMEDKDFQVILEPSGEISALKTGKAG